MKPSIEIAVAVAGSLLCFVSFAWAIKRLFISGDVNSKMSAVKVLGGIFAACQIGALLFGGVHHRSGVVAVGTAMYVAAAALFWCAVRTIRHRRFAVAFTATNPSFVVAEGPYRWIRHPLYTSYLLYWSAGVVVTGQLWLVTSVLVMGVFYVAAIRQEEREFLTSDLAHEYARYRSKTGAFLPRLPL